MKMIGDCRPVRPPEQLMRLMRTVALFWPTSEAEKGCRTQFVSVTVSASIMTTSRPSAMAPDAHRLVEIRQPHDDGAARSACANDQNTDCAMAQQIGRQSVLDAHATPCLRARTAPASAATGSAFRLETACVCPPGRSKVPRTLLRGGSGGRHWRA